MADSVYELAGNKWFAFYTKSRHEKKVKELLERRKFTVFLPLHKVVRQWSDRKKKVEVPLFASYIFVFVPEYRIVDVLQIPGIAWAIRHNNKPAFLQPKEFELINRFLKTGLTIEISPATQFEPGDWVVVQDGPLKGAEGQVTSLHPGRLTVLLEAIGQVMRVDLNPALLQKL